MGDGSRAIRVVTNDESLIASARAAVAPLEGWSVVPVESESDLTDSPPAAGDVILLDGWLSGGNVYEVCRRLTGRTKCRTFGWNSAFPASSIVNRILTGAARAPDLASTLVSTAANLGIAAGAVVGAQALSAGVNYGTLPGIGILFTLIAASVMWGSLRLERRAET